MRTSHAGALLGLAGLTAAQMARYCSESIPELCYQVNIPDATASSGSGDIFIQLQAPNMEWFALGQGQQMRGSNMLVVYSNFDGSNVTISPRLGTGNVMPMFNSDADVELLAGSGNADGMMTANIRCGSCISWSGGEMDISSNQSPWIYAYKEGATLESDDQSVSIMRHDTHGNFMLDLTAARGGDSVNPFANTDSGAPTTEPTGNVGASGGGTEMTGGGGSGGPMATYLTAHGTIMGLAFVLLFPLGVIVRGFAPQTSIWVHAGTQTLAWLLAIAGMGIGIYIATQLGYINEAHSVIGLVVVSVMALQPIGGLLQHQHFKKHGTRSVFGWGHRFMGLALILLGLINGGLGLQLAGNTRSGEIAYGVLAGVFGLAMLAAFGLSTVRSSEPINVDKHTASKAENGNGIGTSVSTNGANGH